LRSVDLESHIFSQVAIIWVDTTFRTGLVLQNSASITIIIAITMTH
jgi:hypothetical protein